MTSERREGISPDSDIQRRPNMVPAGPDSGHSPSWEEILVADPDHERFLKTAEGRFMAAINIIKNGAMVLELAQLRENRWQSYREVNSGINRIFGERVCARNSTRAHLALTVSTVGAAAKSDLDDRDWRRTAFGTALLPAALYVWGKFLEENTNPAKALGSQSQVKKDDDGNIRSSSPYARARILTDLFNQDQASQAEMAKQRSLSEASIAGHLQKLKEAGLVSYESVDAVASFTSFTITPEGLAQAKWPVYKDSRSKLQRPLTKDVDRAITGLAASGHESFTTEDVVDWINVNDPEAGKASRHRVYVNSVLSFFVREGLLERSRMNSDNRSEASLSAKGRVFVEHALLPLEVWAADCNAVAEINQIRERLKANASSANELLKEVAGRYIETSPGKNADIEAKTADIIRIIQQYPGIHTARSISRGLGVSAETAAGIINRLIAVGTISSTVGKTGRKYLSMAGHEESGQSVDNQEGN